MSLADLRSTLAGSFSALPASVYATVPEVVIPPAIVLVPDTPYLVPNIINKSTTKVQVNYAITVAVAYNSNPGSLDNLEQLIMSVLAALPAGYEVGNVTQPMPVKVGPSNLLAADILVSTQYTEGA